VVCELLKLGVDPNQRCFENRTPLIEACLSDYDPLEVVKLLLANQASPNLVSEDGGSAIMCAAGKGHAETCLCLLQNGAQVNLQEEDGFTALMFAC